MAEPIRGTAGPLLEYRIEQRPGGTWIALAGSVTEEAELTKLAGLLSGTLLFDLGGITRINSTGMREWIFFIRDLEEKGALLNFERCSPAVVSQICMISNFMGERGRVRSVLTPYFCPACKAEHTHLIELSVQGLAELERPIPCPTCRSAMELLELRENIEVLGLLEQPTGDG